MSAIYRRIMSMFRLGVVTATSDTAQVQFLQVQAAGGDVRDTVANPCMWGIASRPHPGAQVLFVVPGGADRNAIVLASADNRYQFSLVEGECALYDDLGQSIHITRTGIVINGGGLPIQITNTPTTSVSGDLHASGAIIAGFGGTDAVSLQTHKHPATNTPPTAGT